MKPDDHDLLIRVDTKLQTVIDEMQLMRDSTNTRLTNVENNKVDIKDYQEFKVQVTSQILSMDTEWKKTLLERDRSNIVYQKDVSDKFDKVTRILYIGIGIVVTLQFVIPLIIANLTRG